ncbi:MAG TPA: VanZ family protein [Bacilli bacterium]|nr:VanZ family protein [Bacilli bacterium]
MKKALNIAVITLAVLLNGLIVFESCLPGGVSVTRSNWLSNIFADIINIFIPGRVEVVPLESISLVGNQEITIGTTNRFSVEYAPSNATSKGITFIAGNERINPVQEGSSCFVEGMELGSTSLTAVSSEDSNIFKTVEITVNERPAPTEFELTVTNSQILNGFSERVIFSIDDYTDNRAVRYFDTSLVSLESSNPDIATIEDGVIHAKSVGSATIFASDYPSRLVDIEVIENPNPLVYPDESSWEITGNNVVHIYDMDHAETNFIQLSIDWGETIPSDQSVTWKVEDELLAKIGVDGKLRGYKKTGSTNVIAISNMDTEQQKIFPISVEEVLPTAMDVNIRLDGSPLDEEVSVGDTIYISAIFSPDNTTNLYIDVISSDAAVLAAQIEGRTGKITAKKEGTATITVSSTANPELSETLVFEVMPKKAIDGENYVDFASFIRKSIGHFLLFGVSAIFTTWAFYFILNKVIKKKWFIVLVSGLFGIAVASVTEMIQLFIPLRSGTWIDVGINILGYTIFLALTILFGFLILKRRQKVEANKKSAER